MMEEALNIVPFYIVQLIIILLNQMMDLTQASKLKF